MKELIIIGSGPAGLTAAIYAARAGLEPLVISGSMPGGQLMLTTEVENYPGFPEAIQGPELIEKIRKQAEKFGAEFVNDDATSVDFSSRPFEVIIGEDSYKAKSVIIATGASTKWLGLESEQRLLGKGVSSCATCDALFFKGMDVAVIGGGDAAVEEALFLTKYADKVTIIHRRDELRASKILQDRAFKNKKINFKWNSLVEEVLGKERVEGLLIKNVKTGQTSKFECQGVFIAIGQKPNTDIFKGQIELDKNGYIVAKNNTETNVKGVFVAGDVHDYRYRQAITAAGMGCQAALDAEKYLESLGG
jgi:thioredoxin reductase (NADPH)